METITPHAPRYRPRALEYAIVSISFLTESLHWGTGFDHELARDRIGAMLRAYTHAIEARDEHE